MEIRPEIKFGFTGAFVMICWTIIQYYLGFHSENLHLEFLSGYGNYLIVFIFLIFGIREKRNDLGKKYTLRKGMKSGIYQLILTASISSAFMFLYDYKINNIWVERMVVWQQENGNPSTFYIKIANEHEVNSSILSNTETHLCLYFLGILIVGTSMAFMISASLLKNKPSGINP
jgi:multisubunit Na+/H+ antiporter MnhE subunit